MPDQPAKQRRVALVSPMIVEVRYQEEAGEGSLLDIVLSPHSPEGQEILALLYEKRDRGLSGTAHLSVSFRKDRITFTARDHSPLTE